jgi:hypothetical protein
MSPNIWRLPGIVDAWLHDPAGVPGGAFPRLDETKRPSTAPELIFPLFNNGRANISNTTRVIVTIT